MDAPQRDKLKALALAATPQDFDSAQIKCIGGWTDCPVCGGDGSVSIGADYCNYDGAALGVQFYGIGDEHVNAEAYYRAANPATVLELVEKFEQLQAEVERLRARFEYIEDRASTTGGGNGFTVSFFVPEDCEDIGCGIDEVVKRIGSAPAAGTVKDAERLLITIVRSDIGISTRHKLEDGHGTKTEDGMAWLEAIDFVAAITARAKAGKENA